MVTVFVENAKQSNGGERPAKRSKSSWGWSGLVSTAYSASVFGAALGL